MEFAQERRRELLLAATMDELIEFAQNYTSGWAARLSGLLAAFPTFPRTR